MKILNINGQPIPACAKIPYNGFEISLSTIFSAPSLAIFLNGDDVTKAFFPLENPWVYDLRTAMERIDKEVARVEANVAKLG